MADMMIERDAVFGGEGNGGQSTLAWGTSATALSDGSGPASHGHPKCLSLSRLADELPRYQIYKTKVPLDASQVAAGLDQLSGTLPMPKPTGWMDYGLIGQESGFSSSASNTEPVHS